MQGYCWPTGRGCLRSGIVEEVFAAAGGGALTFVFLWFICRRSVSGSGIPGVGVAPGFIWTFTFAGSMPGVGVGPFSTTLAWPGGGMPGVDSPEGWIGIGCIPAGMLALLAAAWFELPVAPPPQAAAIDTNAIRDKRRKFISGIFPYFA